MIELPILYDHQCDLRDRTRAALAKHGRVILCAQTGMGKTRTAKWILGASANRQPNQNQSGRSLFCVHRRGLVDNAVESFNEEPRLPHGIVMSGRDTSYGSRVQVASIDSLLSWFIKDDRYDTDITFDLIIPDEAHSHHAKYARFLKYHDEKREALGLHPAYVIGLTATPQAKGLADVYKEIVPGPSTQWLIDNGFLSSFRYFRATQGKLGLLVKRGDEFTKESEAAAMDGLAGDLVRDWKQFAEGRPTIGFFPRRSHAKDAVAQLESSGLRVAYVDGETEDTERRTIFSMLNHHQIDYLANVQVVERGTDIPRVGCVQLCVAIGSVVRFRQMVGRGSRVHPAKTDCIVLDHGGNISRHGFFEDDPQWSLDITVKDAGEQGTRPTIECPRCCVARGTMILTDRGEVPIEDVRITDRVWDGIEFCSHDGTCCNGIKEAIHWGGLMLTPDHRALTNGGWKEAETAKSGGWRPVIGGIAGTPIRTSDDSNPYCPLPRSKPRSRSGLFALWKTWLEALPQNLSASSSRMRALFGEVWSGLSGMACSEGQSAEIAMSVPSAPCLRELWWSRYRVSVCIVNGGGALDNCQSWLAAEQVVDHRPDRQQRTLRAGQSAMGYVSNPAAQQRLGLDSAVSPELPVRDVLRHTTNEPEAKWIDTETDRRPLDFKVWRGVQCADVAGQAEAGISICEIQQAPTYLHETKRDDAGADRQPMAVEVWDILNVGPRNRYCANGVIVANCAIYRGGKCRSCGYEPSQKERRGQGLEFDGSELKEVKREEIKAVARKSAEQLMVQALYIAGKSGRTWRQCCGIFNGLCKKQGSDYRIPGSVEIGGHRYNLVRAGSDDGGRKVGDLYPFTVSRGGHGGEYLAKENVGHGSPY